MYYEKCIREFLALNHSITKAIKAFDETESKKKELEAKLSRLETCAGTRIDSFRASIVRKIKALEATLESLKEQRLDYEAQLDLLKQNLTGFRVSVDEVLRAAIPDYSERDYELLCKNGFRMIGLKPQTTEVCIPYYKKRPPGAEGSYFIITVIEKRTGTETILYKWYNFNETVADGTPLTDCVSASVEAMEGNRTYSISLEVFADRIKHLLLGAEDFRYSAFLQKNLAAICKSVLQRELFRKSPH